MNPSRNGISARAFERLVHDNIDTDGFDFRVDHLSPGEARLHLSFDQRHLRPGGTISGPVMFTLSDTVLYALVLSVDKSAMMAVTTDMSIRFLRRPPATDLIAHGRLIKPEGRLIIGECTIYSAEDTAKEGPVAHATGTYLVPRELRRPSTDET